MVSASSALGARLAVNHAALALVVDERTVLVSFVARVPRLILHPLTIASGYPKSRWDGPLTIQLLLLLERELPVGIADEFADAGHTLGPTR